MRILIAPDKFKGSLSAPEVAKNIAHGLAHVLPQAKIDILPLADGGEGNAAGDPTFAGYLTRDRGTLRALAITCPHLGCSYAYDNGKKHFVCPCHGSEFALDGALLHGPATSPLSHLTWTAGPNPNEIDVEGLNIGS